MRAVVVACVLAACGDNDPGAVEGRSGTRLALSLVTYEDGTVQIDRGVVRDTERGEDCTPERWTDGLLYCTPLAVEIVYVDGQCLTRAGRVPRGSTARYAAERGVGSLIARLYRLGQPYAGGTGLSWRLDDSGQCVGPFAGVGDAQFVELAAVQSRDQFARIKDVEIGGGRLHVVEDTSDDGLVLPARFHDRQLALDCDANGGQDDAITSCAPVGAAVASYFADAACSVPVAAVTTSSPPPAIASDSSACARYDSTGAEVAADSVREPGSCGPLSSQADAHYFAAGSEVALTTVTRDIAAGGRLRLVRLDGVLDDRFVHDTALGADCAPGLLDGQRRCLPAAAEAQFAERYTDAACGERVEVAYVAAHTCAPAARFMIDPSGAWRRLGPAIDTPLYARVGGACTLAELPADTRALAASLPLPPSTFAAVRDDL